MEGTENTRRFTDRTERGKPCFLSFFLSVLSVYLCVYSVKLYITAYD